MFGEVSGEIPRQERSGFSAAGSRFAHAGKAPQVKPAGPMVLHAKVCGRLGRRRIKLKRLHSEMNGAFCVSASLLVEERPFRAALDLLLSRASALAPFPSFRHPDSR
jgi:hypothetical protein